MSYASYGVRTYRGNILYKYNIISANIEYNMCFYALDGVYNLNLLVKIREIKARILLHAAVMIK